MCNRTAFYSCVHGDLYCGDSLAVLKSLPSEIVNCCVTSPPYFGLRDYGVDGQIGLEETPEAYVANLVEVFGEVRRVLRDDGTLWLNIGDSYEVGKQLLGIPWRLAFALKSDGWYLRQDIIWNKPNPMPESVKDRCTKAHEYVFLLSKSQKYYFDSDAIKEDATSGPAGTVRKNQPRAMNSTPIFQSNRGNHKQEPRKQGAMGITEDGKRNRRSVWNIATRPYSGAHFAVFPPQLVEPCILAGCPTGGVVLDPFFGSGTTGMVARKLRRKWIGIDINEQYCGMALDRIDTKSLSLVDML